MTTPFFCTRFLDLEVERKFQSWISSKLLVPSSTTSKIIFKFLAYVWTHFALSYALVPFVLLHWDPTYAVWESVGFIGHVIVAAVFGLDLVIPKSGSGKRRNQDVKIE